MHIEEFARLGEQIADLLDHADALTEHCYRQEDEAAASAATLASLGARVRFVATDFACSCELDPEALCASRMESFPTLSGVPYEWQIGSAADAAPLTWRGLQLAEAEHRTLCGMSEKVATLAKRLSHYSGELGLVAANMASRFDMLSPDWEEALRPELADLFLLGVSFATDACQELPDCPIPRTHDEFAAALAEDGLE